MCWRFGGVHQAAPLNAGAVPRVIAARLGAVNTADGVALQADGSYENSPSVLFDAVAIAPGEAGNDKLAAFGQTMEFLVNQYRHGKTILALGTAVDQLPHGISASLSTGEDDPGVLTERDANDEAISRFIVTVGLHRYPSRETDPPRSEHQHQARDRPRENTAKPLGHSFHQMLVRGQQRGRLRALQKG